MGVGEWIFARVEKWALRRAHGMVQRCKNMLRLEPGISWTMFRSACDNLYQGSPCDRKWPFMTSDLSNNSPYVSNWHYPSQSEVPIQDISNLYCLNRIFSCHIALNEASLNRLPWSSPRLKAGFNLLSVMSVLFPWLTLHRSGTNCAMKCIPKHNSYDWSSISCWT